MDQTLKERISSKLRPQFRTTYQADRGQFVINEFSAEVIDSDLLNKKKEFFKRTLTPIYPRLITLLSPVYGQDPVPAFLKQANADEFIVNLGSGTHAYRNVVNVDGAGYPNVHVVANLEELPFEDGSVDRIISVAVLEHATTPIAHVAEFMRVLKPAGRLLVFVPFLQPFHAAPHDYQRYTDSGLRQLFREFEMLTVTVCGGPTSALLWTLQEWLSMVLSFGSLRIYKFLLPLFWVLSPLKVLDALLEKHPAARIAASGFTLTARKPAGR